MPLPTRKAPLPVRRRAGLVLSYPRHVAPTVLIIASDWLETRSVSYCTVQTPYSILDLARKSKSCAAGVPSALSETNTEAEWPAPVFLRIAIPTPIRQQCQACQLQMERKMALATCRRVCLPQN